MESQIELTEAATAGGEIQQTETWWEKIQPSLIVAASTTLIFTGCGINFAFGVYQELYDSMAAQPNTPFTGSTPAQIDLIGTLSISMMTIGAPFATSWTKLYSPRSVILAGGLIFSVALVLASFSQTLWQFLLTQGFLLGIGTCFSYMPSVTVAPTWFTRHRGLAMGIILSGTGLGGIAWPLALRSLIDHVGFRNTLRITGTMSFVFIWASGFFLRWPQSQIARIQAENSATASRTSGLFQLPVVNWRVARTRKFFAHALGGALQAAAYYTPVFFFASYARTLGYSQATSANFIALSNAANAIGKVAIGYMADRFGRLNTLFISTFLSAVSALALWLPSCLSATQSGGRVLFVTFTIFYGVFASAYVSLFPTSLVELFGVQNFASVNGLLYMLRGMATLVGTPVAGVLIRSNQQSSYPKSYENTSIMVGLLLAAAAASVFWVRIEAVLTMEEPLQRRRKWLM